MNPIQPLKNNWKPDGTKDKHDILERVRSEDNFTNSRNYPLTTYEDSVDILCPRAERIVKKKMTHFIKNN